MKDDLTLVISAIRYIEENLKEKLSIEAISDEVGFSKYYFSRLFAKYTGQSPYDYYRGRKLTETIAYMQKKKCKIIDAAYEYGFSSPEVFARACATVFGKSPSAIKKQIMDGTFQGVRPMSEGYLWFANNYNCEPRLQLMDAIDLMGVGYFSENLNESLYTMSIQQLKSLGHSGNTRIFKVSWMERQAMGYMNFIGRQSVQGTSGDVMLTKKLPKMAYLVFDFTLPVEDLNYFYAYIYNHYLPESGYEVITPIHIEVFTIENNTRCSQLYIPVVPKVR